MTKMYGVKLISYGGQIFNSWVYNMDEMFKSSEIEEAYSFKRDYEIRNPKGHYVVEEIIDTPDN